MYMYVPRGIIPSSSLRRMYIHTYLCTEVRITNVRPQFSQAAAAGPPRFDIGWVA